jgi:hyaluronan-mediated motility receptor
MESEHMQEEVRRDVYGLLEAQRQDYEERTKELGEALAETRLVLAERDMDLQHTQEAFELQEEELENTYAYCEHLQSVLECTEHEAEQVLQHIRVYELETKEMLTDHSEQTEWLQHTLVDTQDLAVDQTTLAHYLEHESLHTELVDQHDRDIHQELEWIDAETMYDYELYQDRLRYSTETDNLTDDLDASRNELVEFKKLYGAREAELMKQMERLKEDHERRIKEEHGALLDELAKSKAEIERLKLNEKKQKKEQERVEKEKEDARKLMDVLKRQIDDGETEMTELNQQLQELREQNIEMVDQREQELQYLKLKHAHAYGEVVRLNGENADLLGHKNEKQRIHYVKRIQQDNQKLKKDNLTLMQERDQQKRRAERLEREMEGYRSISINGSAAPPATVRAPARTKSNSVSVTKTPAKRGSVDITAARRTSLLPTDNEL